MVIEVVRTVRNRDILKVDYTQITNANIIEEPFHLFGARILKSTISFIYYYCYLFENYKW